MRILAIRGQNLTSLAGEFEVDFEAEPLGSAGIFAITGPTGAGKSTLLDTVCLALFNQVPRLASATSGEVGPAGGELISTGDPRALLRHRAGEGYAEVDFIGLDRGRYRARWAVRRARGRSDGALQNVTQSLINLESGERLGGTRTETLAEIRRIIGLTAQQFGRAVMLAQGEFNAFIDADANTRAELLEKLTGTGLYARLGMAARQKADGLRQNLAETEARIGALSGLDDILRAEAETRLAETRQAHDAASAVVAAYELARSWYVRMSELDRLVESAAETRVTACHQQTQSEPRRTALEGRRRAFSFVPRWQAVAEADIRFAESVTRVAELKEQVGLARDHAEQAGEQDRAAADALRIVEERREKLRPELETARILDQRLGELKLALVPLAQTNVAAGAAADASAAAYHLLLEQQRHATERRSGLASWLAEHPAQDALVSRRDDLVAGLAEHERDVVTSETLKQNVEELGIRLADSRTQITRAEAAETNAREVLALAEQKCAEARAALPALQAAAEIEEKRDRLMGIEPCLLAFERGDSDLVQLGTAITSDRSEETQLGQSIAQSRTRKAEIEAVLPTIRAQHYEALRAGALSAAASGDAAEQLRATLVVGDPCPVCGGTDHALVALAEMIDGRAAADADRIASLARDIENLSEERAVLTDRLKQEGARHSETSARLRSGEASLEATADRRATALSELETALRGCGMGVFASPEALRAEILGELAAIDARRLAIEAARSSEQQAAQAADVARADFGSAAETHRLAERALRELEVESGRCADRLVEADRRLDQVARELDAGLSPHFDWRTDRAAVATLDGLVAARQCKMKELAAVDSELPGLAKAVHDADILRSRDSASLDGALQAEQSCRQDHDDVACRRAELFDGEATDRVAARLGEAVQSAAQLRDAARIACETARSQVAAANARHDQAVAALGTDRAEIDARRAALAIDLAAASISETLIEGVAADGEAALDAEVQAIEAIDRAVVIAETEWQSRLADRDRHAASSPPTIASAELDAAWKDAAQGFAEAREALGEAELVIRHDDRAREATAALRGALEQDRAAAFPWLQLDTLIGDATGNKFRRFAQGLTLERLLLHANARLAELKPRYSLERAPGGDMLVQVVDHDMAGEVRGLPNLSGGERFLMSLALALGLSEMSTGQGLRVESLFIDEGFGALDSASLGQAIAVLEQLHATGRRVGVISHIEEVKERIAIKIEVAPATNGRSIIEVQES